mgnify:CR=1 FL=1
MIHSLKTWPEYFEAVLSGKKNFEVRKNDRDYNVGHVLILKEWNPETESYTGREIARGVSYILHGGSFGIESGTVVMSLS